eukprot:symbB.v1.2.031624.t2/scaffold3690.1/size51928/1
MLMARMVESGTHGELMTLKGVYYQLQMQSQSQAAWKLSACTVSPSWILWCYQICRISWTIRTRALTTGHEIEVAACMGLMD